MVSSVITHEQPHVDRDDGWMPDIPRDSRKSHRLHPLDAVDAYGEDSFPASDPPSWWSGR
jgi:hypothetical protein